MKKFSALLLVIVMVAALGVNVFAAKIETVSQFVSFDTAESTEYYNPENTVYVKFDVSGVTLEGADGVSALDFELCYDSDLVEPVVQPSYDGEGDRCDFSSLLVSNPGGAWEVFGTLDSENSRYVLGFADWYVENVITAETVFTVSVPFKVKADTRVDDIVFSFENVKAYNADLSKGCEVAVDDVVIRYALQSDENVSLPSDFVSLDIAGYKHDINNVIYFVNEDTTVAEYVSKFMTPVSGQDTMSSFGILICDLNGEIIYSDLTDSDKSELVIPADSYIIGIYSENTDDISYVEGLLGLGASVELYNVNVESTSRLTEGTPLDSAGFSIVEFKTEEGANAYIDYEAKTVTVYEKDVTLQELDDMIVGDISVIGKNGYLSSSSLVGTGNVIDYLDGYTVIVLGDVNGDGKVNQFDCIAIKAYVLKGSPLTEYGFKAACITGKKPMIFDYLAIKSYYFGKRDFISLNPNK